MNKYAKILNGASGTYPRVIENFIGLDCAADAANISPRRMARCVNMWRDYESESGGAIETVPGWRKLFSAGNKVNGMFVFRSNGNEYLIVHAKDRLYRVLFSRLESGGSLSSYDVGKVNDASSVYFESGGKCYFLDGEGYYSIGSSGQHELVTTSAYIPVTYMNGEPYQQRNMLSSKFIERYTVSFQKNKLHDPESPWEYQLVTEGKNAPYLKLIGLADGYSASELIYAYVPDKDLYEGTRYPVLDFAPNFFDLLPYTVQLVVDAPLTFFGLSGSGASRGRYSGSISGMGSLQRLILRHRNSDYEFNACDSYDSSDGSPIAVPTTPLRELWLNGNGHGAFDLSIGHEYSTHTVGITSAYEGNVVLYVGHRNEVWVNGSPSKTTTVDGVVFTSERTGGVLILDGVTDAALKSDIGATVEISEGSKRSTVYFDAGIAYSHIHLEAGGKVYCIMLRDNDTGVTGEENGKWFEYTVFEPLKEVTAATVDGTNVLRYRWNAAAGKAMVMLSPQSDGGTLDLRIDGYPNKFSSIENLSTVYDNGFSEEISAAEAINQCTVVCSYDGRVFFTGNPALPNTVFFSGRGLNGENDPTYIGIYNYFNDGIGNVPNTAMVSSASMLAVLKGDISTDACAYYHVAQYNSDERTADLLPRIYPSTEGVSNVPCVGAACNFADDIVFLSPNGLEAVEKQTLNLERTLSHRSGRIDPILRKTLSESSRMVEWKGYLCVLNRDGTMMLADSRAITQNEATGEYQYEWFMLDGVGSYLGDMTKWAYGSGTVRLIAADGTEADIPLTELSVIYKGTEYPIRVGSGEVADGAAVISFGSVTDNGGTEYTAVNGIRATMVDGCFCPVTDSGERIGGTFYPATAIFEHRGKLYFGTKNGDVCVLNTDKRGVSYDEGEEPGVISSRWYDRCGHRYESGFATLFDDCGYPQFAKSTVGKTLTLRAKRMPNSAFKLTVRSEREDWGQNEVFTASELSFRDMDFSNFSFEDNYRGVFSSSEKLKRWGEKQMYFYSDGFHCPFGLYGISYCYSFAGRIR